MNLGYIFSTLISVYGQFTSKLNFLPTALNVGIIIIMIIIIIIIHVEMPCAVDGAGKSND